MPSDARSRAGLRHLLRSLMANTIASAILTSSATGARAQAAGDFVEDGPSRSAPERLSREHVRAVFAAHRVEVVACAEAERRNATAQPQPSVIAVELVIAASGQVTSVTVRDSRRPLFAACIERTLLVWRFPASEHGGRVIHPLSV